MSNRKRVSRKENPSKKHKGDNSDEQGTINGDVIVQPAVHPTNHPTNQPTTHPTIHLHNPYREFMDKCLLLSITDWQWFVYNIPAGEFQTLRMDEAKTTEKIKFLRNNGINIRVAMDRTINPKNKVVDLINHTMSIHSASGSYVATIHNYPGNILKLSSISSGKIGISVNYDTPDRALLGYYKIKSSYPK